MAWIVPCVTPRAQQRLWTWKFCQQLLLLSASACLAALLTEIGRMSLKYKYLADKGVKVAALSCNALGEHQVGWQGRAACSHVAAEHSAQ